jgi:hypothetical protein
MKTFLLCVNETIARLSQHGALLLPRDLELAECVRMMAQRAVTCPWTWLHSVAYVPEGCDAIEDTDCFPPHVYAGHTIYQAGRDLWWLIQLRFSPPVPMSATLTLPADTSLYTALALALARVGATLIFTAADAHLASYALELARGAWGHEHQPLLAIRELPPGVAHLDGPEYPRAYRPRPLFDIARELVWLQVLLTTVQE